MCNWGLWEKETVVHSITCKLFQTKREMATRQEVAEVSLGPPRLRARASWGRVGTGELHSHLREVTAVWAREDNREHVLLNHQEG